jgi:predicted small metal-binding protein
MVEREIGEQGATLAARERAVDATASKLDVKPTAELDSCRRHGLQPFSKVVHYICATGVSENRVDATDPMARQIKCECGYVARAESDDEVIELTMRHIRSDHPEFAETETREEVASWIEVVD